MVYTKAAKAMNDRWALVTRVNAMGGLWESKGELQHGLEKVKNERRGEKKLVCLLHSSLRLRWPIVNILEQPVIHKADCSYSQGL